MSTTVFYNGVTLRQARIDEYRVDSPASFGSPHTGPLRHSLSGEALVFVENPSTPAQFMNTIKQLLNQPRQGLKIEIDDPSGTLTIVDKQFPLLVPDEEFGPFFRANVTQITGTNCLMVNFSCEWSESADSPNRIRSFYCTASFSIDEVGNTTIRKRGSIKVAATNTFPVTAVAQRNQDRAGSSNTGIYGGDAYRSDVVTDFITSVGTGGGSVPDLYRRFVSGNLYPGFRRVRQEYAVDETRTTMLFDVVDQEFTRGMPAPARVGNCQYTFERSMGEGTQMIGTKHFVASVKGDRFVTAGALLTLCIRLSQNRINYVSDLIVKIRVTEENMLTENAVTFEVVATATSAQTFNASATEGSASAGSTSLIDQSLLLKNILSPIQLSGGVFEFVPAMQPEAYGNAMIVRLTPAAYDHQSIPALSAPNMSLPTTMQLAPEDMRPVVYLFPQGWFDGVEGQDGNSDGINTYIPKGTPAVPTGPNAADLEKNKTSNGQPVETNPNLHSKGGKKVEVKSNIIVVPAVCPTGKPAVFQIAGPVVVETEFIDGARKNEPPERLLADKTAGAVVTSVGYNVTSGHPDMNGNRVMIAGYDRTTVTACPGDFDETTGVSPTNPSFKVVEANFNGQTVNIVAYNPAKIPMPLDQTQGAEQPEYTDGLGDEETFLA